MVPLESLGEFDISPVALREYARYCYHVAYLSEHNQIPRNFPLSPVVGVFKHLRQYYKQTYWTYSQIGMLCEFEALLLDPENASG